MSEFRDLFQPVPKKELERRKELAHYEEMIKKKRCGQCEHWMKTSECPREARGFKVSMNDWTCNNYELEYYYVDRIAELREVVK